MKANVRPEKRCLKLPHWGRILVYPDNPSDLLHEHPAVYGMAYPDAQEKPENGPMECPLDAQLLAQLTQSLPMRKSHRSLRLMAPMKPTLTGLSAMGAHLTLNDAAAMPHLRPPRDAELPGPSAKEEEEEEEEEESDDTRRRRRRRS